MNRVAWGMVLALLAPVALAGCESNARQDSLLVRPSTDTLVFRDTPLFRDRPLNEGLLSSLTLADYTVALRKAGLLTTLQRPGPFTVFAIPNSPMEAAQAAQGGHMLDAANVASLRRLMAYTIVRGRYAEATLRQMIAKRNGPIGLSTIDGDVLSVSVEPTTNQLLLGDGQGHLNRIWLADMPQANGVLFATQSMLVPGATTVAAR